MDKWTKFDEIEYPKKKKEFWLCLLLGWCGVHRFYRKKIGTGILYFFTFGCFCIGWIADIIIIVLELEKIKNVHNMKETLSKNQDVDVESIVLNNGRNRIEAIKEYQEMTGASLKAAMDIVDSTYDSMGINLQKKYCPKCGSGNCHAFVEDETILQGKTKMQTSVNLNPLKPFTLFNTKEKVVREPWTMQVSKFVCDDCGKIFQ